MKSLFRRASPLLVVCITFLIALSALLGIYDYFSVKEIHIEGPNEIKGTKEIMGMFMPLIQEEKLEKRLSVQNPSLTSIQIFKQFPHTLFISALRLRSSLAIKLVDGHVLISEKGSVLEKRKSDEASNLPVVKYYQPLFLNQFTIGEVVEQNEIASAAYATSALVDLGIAVTEIILVTKI
jgi:hypothetical protein